MVLLALGFILAHCSLALALTSVFQINRILVLNWFFEFYKICWFNIPHATIVLIYFLVKYENDVKLRNLLTRNNIFLTPAVTGSIFPSPKHPTLLKTTSVFLNRHPTSQVIGLGKVHSKPTYIQPPISKLRPLPPTTYSEPKTDITTTHPS